MSVWFTIYCGQLVDQVSSSDILTAIQTLSKTAEYQTEENQDLVKQCLSSLEIIPIKNQSAIKFSVHYGAFNTPPILIYCWSQPIKVDEKRAEGIEQLNIAQKKEYQYILNHLEQTKEVVVMELGWHAIEETRIQLARCIAEYIASMTQGIIQDQNDDWWEVKDQKPILLMSLE